jgi:hypothetical protein
MSNYNWCHGPNCHTNHTQSRIRGSGDNKVLRTIKIKQGRYNYSGRPELITYDDYFCNQSCLMDYIRTHLQTIVAIAPRREALETPIKVVKEKYESTRWDWNNGIDNRPQQVPYMATRTTIKSVDND